MKLRRVFACIAGLALAVLTSRTVVVKAQTVISNETLVTTTLVVNKHNATAECRKTGCSATRSMFAPISVICPAAAEQTCTFHISVDAKVFLFSGAEGFYQFLVDGLAPTIGPTSEEGRYLFVDACCLPPRQGYPAAVVTTVTNSSSNSHTIALNVGCADTDDTGGCAATAHSSTMRVDVFEP